MYNTQHTHSHYTHTPTPTPTHTYTHTHNIHIHVHIHTHTHTSQKYGNTFVLLRFTIRRMCSVECMCFSKLYSKKEYPVNHLVPPHAPPTSLERVNLLSPTCPSHFITKITHTLEFVCGTLVLPHENTPFRYPLAVELCMAEGAEILIVCDSPLHHQHLLVDSSQIFHGELGGLLDIRTL